MKSNLMKEFIHTILLWIRLGSSLILFIPFLLFFYFSTHVVPAGDDWGFGLLSKGEMGNWGQMIFYYKNFHGRYFSHLILPMSMNFEDSYFHYRLFVSGHYLAFFGSIFYFFHQLSLLGKKAWSVGASLVMTGILFTFIVLNLQRPSETYFWFSQIANYSINIPLLFTFLAMIIQQRNLIEKNNNMSLLLTITASLFSIFLIGTCEATVFLQPTLVGTLAIFLFLTQDKQWPLFKYIAGATLFFFFVAALSPGHAGRLAGQFGPLKGDLFGSLSAALPLYGQILKTTVSNNFFKPLIYISIFPIMLLALQLKSINLKRKLCFLYFSFSILIQLAGLVMISVAIYKSGRSAPLVGAIIPSRAQVPIFLYFYFSFFSLIAAITFYLESHHFSSWFAKKFTHYKEILANRLITRRKLPSLGLKNLTLKDTSIFILTIVLFQFSKYTYKDQRIKELVKYLPHLTRYAAEQDYRLQLVKTAVNNGVTSVHLPKMTSKIPYSYHDIEDSNDFGYRTNFAGFFGVKEVIIDKKFKYCHSRICGLEEGLRK